MICHTCQSLLRRVEDLYDPEIEEAEYPHLDHHVTIDSLLQAVAAGCFICRKLKDEVPDFSDAQKCPPGSAKSLNYYSIFARQPRQSGPPDLKICFMTSYYGGGAPTVILRPLPKSYLNPSPTLLPPSTGHPLVLNRAALWLTTCLTAHHVCNQYFTPSNKIPSRLLDLCPFDIPKGSFRLIDTAMLTHDQTPYVTLSHRWGTGSHKPFQLTKLTRDSLFGGLPVSTLSGLFQDAVKVVLILNLRYLWIDSLCIFQDDTQNIVAEAQNMSVVYGNAVCNIAALTAAQETMFAERESGLVSSSATIAHAQQNGTSHSYAIADASLWTRSIFKAPLSHRGWVLQEQILARRTLYFGQEQLLWSCPSSASCETYPMDDNVWSQDRFFVFQGGFDQIRRVSSGNSLVPNPIMSSRQVDMTPEGCWRQIVEEYATRQLTHASDKLLALAGVAKSLGQVTDDTILAGMWRKEMPLNLLWIVGSSTGFSDSRRDPATFRTSTDDCGAPSWSWASRDGPVTFPRTDSKSTKTIAQVNDVCTTTRGRSTNHTVPSWDIQLRAAALRIVRWNDKRPWYGFLPRSDSLSKKIAVMAVTHFDMLDSEVTKSSYIAVFISCMTIYDRKSKRSKSAVYGGLILDHHTKGNTRQVYTRVGTFQVKEDFQKGESEQFMPLDSTLAESVVDDSGRVEHPPVKFDVDWMQTFMIC